MAAPHFGEIGGVSEGTTFPNRRALADAGVHRPTQAGIAGGGSGADSIVVSGGYVDDQDFGDRIIYTGQGGQDPTTKRQVADQQFRLGNKGLAVSADEGLPVRVIRGSGGDPAHSPTSGFRYDGLFTVNRYWTAVGRHGFRIWRFELLRIPELGASPPGSAAAPRVETTVQRLVRNTAIGSHVKTLHAHRCQCCGAEVMTRSGPYAEAAHIRPLGSPHHGPDTIDNVLCLCPNCHVRFDRLAIYVDDVLNVVDAATGMVIGAVRTHPQHTISGEQLAYQRDLCGD